MCMTLSWMALNFTYFHPSVGPCIGTLYVRSRAIKDRSRSILKFNTFHSGIVPFDLPKTKFIFLWCPFSIRLHEYGNEQDRIKKKR